MLIVPHCVVVPAATLSLDARHRGGLAFEKAAVVLLLLTAIHLKSSERLKRLADLQMRRDALLNGARAE